MSRPEPTILATYIDPNSYAGSEVLEADAYYGVMYKGRPINLRAWRNIDVRTIAGQGPKYPKTCFANSAHCFNLRDKLNAQFNTTDFTVVEFKVGRVLN